MMNKKNKILAICISLELLFSTTAIHAQGLYGNEKESAFSQTFTESKQPETASGTGLYADPAVLKAEPGLPPGPGEKELPVADGILILAALAGAWFVMHRVPGRVKN